MIQYEHLSFLAALLQVRGTVIQLALPHIFINFLTCALAYYIVEERKLVAVLPTFGPPHPATPAGPVFTGVFMGK